MAERPETVKRRVREYLGKVESVTGDLYDDSAILDDVDETLSSDTNIEVLSHRYGFPTPEEMGRGAAAVVLGQEARTYQEAYEECEARKAGERSPGAAESCRIVATPTGSRRYCVVDGRAGRFVKSRP